MNRATALLTKALRVTSRSCTKSHAPLFKTAARSITVKSCLPRVNPLLQNRGIAHRPRNTANPLEMKEEYDEIMEELRQEEDIELPDKHDPKPEMVFYDSE